MSIKAEKIKCNAEEDLFDKLNVKIEEIQQDYVLVSKQKMAQLTLEINQLKDGLAKVVNKDVIQSTFKQHTKQLECRSIAAEKQKLQRELELFNSRHESTLVELEKERQQQSKDMSDAMVEQSLFWTKFGSNVCTLLWKASNNDESVKAMLNGDSGLKFLEVASYAYESYFTALRLHKFAKAKELSAEHDFIFMLTGFLTNMTASSFGREFLMKATDKDSLLDTASQLLVDLSLKDLEWAKLRNLLLKIFYNLSLNERGLLFVSEQQNLLKALSQSLSDDQCMENKLQSIRILHSILLEPGMTNAIQQVLHLIPREKLSSHLQYSSGEVKEALQELEMEYRVHGRES
ncbi:heat shock factor 2-binding protein-like isoform X2 [Clytia hemisphaerica]|uniref:Uncharacterized protein n=1 Tax=Clytia hemisphaerica TaxID=252671 RepID=A0A7M5V8G4_9CNID|eukprot:TCONS_00022945-protein